MFLYVRSRTTHTNSALQITALDTYLEPKYVIKICREITDKPMFSVLLISQMKSLDW